MNTTNDEDVPVDLSSHRSSINSASRPVLKDNNNIKSVKCTKLSSEEEKKLVRKLTKQLRNEETKYILLQKLKISQKQAPSLPLQKALHHSTTNDSLSHVTKTITSNINTASQIINKAENFSQNKSWIQTSINNNINPKSNTLSTSNFKSTNGHSKAELTDATKSTNKNGTSSTHGSSSLSSQIKNSQQLQQQEATAKQAATMQMLRKQLERALLQIPPPKPPVPDMPLIPNAGSAEFVVLLGLEVAVDAISKKDQKIGSDTNCKNGDEPNSCEQCSTDFTPQWQKTEIEGKMTTLCERCMNNKRKRALKREHTNRLKSAFVKALQQEQEMEKAMKSELRQLPRSSSDAKAGGGGSGKSATSSVSNGGSRRSPQVIDQARQHQQQLLARNQLLSSVSSLAATSPSPIQTPFQLADLERLMMFGSKALLSGGTGGGSASGGLHYTPSSSQQQANTQQLTRDLMAVAVAAAMPQQQQQHRNKDKMLARAHQTGCSIGSNAQQHRSSPYSRP